MGHIALIPSAHVLYSSDVAQLSHRQAKYHVDTMLLYRGCIARISIAK